MDGVTQQNATLVEEAAAAADSLKEQARTLVALVGAFRISSRTVASLAPTPESAVTPIYGETQRRPPFGTATRSREPRNAGDYAH